MILPIRSAASTSKSITPTVSSIDHCCPIDDIGRNHASRKAIERSTTSGSINLPIWRAPRAGPGSSQWISLNLNPSVRLVKHLLKDPTQKEASEGRSRRISGQPRPILAHLGQSRPISANLGQSRPTPANLGRPRPFSANLGLSRPALAILVHPWPTRQSPRPTRPTTVAHAPISYQWSMAGPSSALPPSPPATPQSSPVSSVTGPSDRTEPARHPQRPSLRPYATRAEGSEIDRGARRTRLLPHTKTTIPI